LCVNATELDAIEYLVILGPMGPTDLARRLRVTTAATTTIVDRVVALGHPRRTGHPTDRRAVVVVPSPESVDRVTGEIMPVVRGIDASVADFSVEEHATIIRYLDRVVASFRPGLPAA